MNTKAFSQGGDERILALLYYFHDTVGIDFYHLLYFLMRTEPK
jgi:hypothetical protein